jgi:hypothetical protein
MFPIPNERSNNTDKYSSHHSFEAAKMKMLNRSPVVQLGPGMKACLEVPTSAVV